MTLKELKAKIEQLPDDAVVRFTTGADDNIINDYYDATMVMYFEILEKDGVKAVYITQN